MRTLRLCLPLGLALCLLLAGSSPPARAQAKKEDKPAKSERVRFDTVDGVEIEGTFWPSTLNNRRRAPVAMLLHRYGGKSHEDGWDHLAEELQKKGFAVLSFDFRGHGGSTTVASNFWVGVRYPYNRQLVRGYKIGQPAAQQPNTIDHKDFSARYVPYLANDIAAAKMYLERRNDSSELNVSNLVLIGAEEGATLGALWLASETHRHQLLPGFPPQPAATPESKDVIACVWLTPSLKLGRITVPFAAWIQEAGREHKVPMAFVYGEEDTEANKLSEQLVRVIRRGYQRGKELDDEYKATGEKGVPKTKLAGSKLLSNALDTEKWIVETYLDGAILEKYGGNEWEKRDAKKYPYRWVFGRFGLPAKGLQVEHLAPLPLAQLGIR